MTREAWVIDVKHNLGTVISHAVKRGLTLSVVDLDLSGILAGGMTNQEGGQPDLAIGAWPTRIAGP